MGEFGEAIIELRRLGPEWGLWINERRARCTSCEDVRRQTYKLRVSKLRQPSDTWASSFRPTCKK
jgi:hypothetical protein